MADVRGLRPDARRVFGRAWTAPCALRLTPGRWSTSDGVDAAGRLIVEKANYLLQG